MKELINICEKNNLDLLFVVHEFLINSIKSEANSDRKEELIKIYNESSWRSAGEGIGQAANSAINWLKGTGVGRWATNKGNEFLGGLNAANGKATPAGWKPKTIPGTESPDQLDAAKTAMSILQQANLLGPFKDQFNKLVSDLSAKQKSLSFGEWLKHNE